MNTIKGERRKTAQYRFRLFDSASAKPTEAYRYSVLDEEAEPKTLAKFRAIEDAELFLSMRREVYAKKGA